MYHKIYIDLGCNKEAAMSEFNNSWPRCIANCDVTVRIASKSIMAAALLHPRSMSSAWDILRVPIKELISVYVSEYSGFTSFTWMFLKDKIVSVVIFHAKRALIQWLISLLIVL
jgi:hypothetical protein